MRVCSFVMLVICLLLSACANPLTPPSVSTTVPSATDRPPVTAAPPASTSTPEPTAQATKPLYKQADCKFKPSKDVKLAWKVTCGYLTVPEDRGKPNGKTIRLAVAVFASKSKSPRPDPIIYLEGGPGGHALEGIPQSFADRFEPFLADRDFIMFDQRGTGYSEPALDCPELIDIEFKTLDQNLSFEESEKLGIDTILKCHDRLAKEDVNLTAYTSAASAADLNDLRVALGYDTWNLYGISYGTRLALTEMRDFPAGIRSVVLDSTVPLQASEADIPANANRAFKQLFDGCAADAACNQAFPNLEQTFNEMVDQLNKKPVLEKAVDPLSSDHKEYSVLLNGDTVVSTLFQWLYVSDVIPLLPKVIDDARKGTDYSLLARLRLLSVVEEKFVSLGMHYAVECSEEVPFSTHDELANADQPFPELHHAVSVESYYEICQQWSARPAGPIENQPVSSDIPTLVLSGEYDPITPPSYGKIAAETLSKSFYFVFPGLGHGVSNDHPCPRGIMTAFLDKPTVPPNATCIKEMHGPKFAVPVGEIALEPFEDTQFGIKGVRPKGWVELVPGAYSPSKSDEIVIVQQSLPGSGDSAVQFWSSRLGLTEAPAVAGTRKTNHLTWKLYELSVQGQPVDLAVAEREGKAFVVVLVSTDSEHDTLYKRLFLPAIDAYDVLK